MKAKFEMLCIIVLGLCFSGCGVKNAANDDTLRWTTAVEDNRVLSTEAIEETSSIMAETVEDTFKYYSDMRYAETYRNVSLSELGIIYRENGGGRLHLVTIDEGEDMIFCYDATCSHPDIQAEYGTPECMAVLYTWTTRAAYYNRTLYIFNNNSFYEQKIYAMDINNSERRIIAKLPFNNKPGTFVLFRDDEMYYIARIMSRDEITGELSAKYRLVEVSLRDGSYRFLTEETEDAFSEAHLTGNTLWIRRSDQNDKGHLYLETVDINTLETAVVIDKDEWVLGNHYVDAYDEDSYYYWDEVTYKIGIKNIDGSVEKVLLQGAEGESFWPADPSGDKLFYSREYDFGDEPIGSYFMDVKTGEVTDITREVEKYDIVGYDCYYDVFISLGEEFNYEIWSREKIIEEALAD